MRSGVGEQLTEAIGQRPARLDDVTARIALGPEVVGDRHRRLAAGVNERVGQQDDIVALVKLLQSLRRVSQAQRAAQSGRVRHRRGRGGGSE